MIWIPDPDPHQGEKLDPDPHQGDKSNPDPDQCDADPKHWGLVQVLLPYNAWQVRVCELLYADERYGAE
jgi:hypothetical protein